MLEKAKRYAQYLYPVLIYGEEGTEIQQIAEAIHHDGPNKNFSFLRIDCQDLKNTDIIGLFYEENLHEELLPESPCTVFLSNINTLSYSEQHHLRIQMQQNRAFRKNKKKTGKTRIYRFIASSTEDLALMVKEKRFSQILYYMLSQQILRIPPLRERPEDILGYAEQHISQMKNEIGRLSCLTNDAKEYIKNYSWPGNIIQLRAVRNRVLFDCSGYYIHAEDIAAHIDQELYTDFSLKTLPSFRNSEKERIQSALAEFHGDRKETAAALGISVSTLWRKMQKYGIPKNEGKPTKDPS